MAAIKYTLSQDARLRAPTPEAERDWLARAHEVPTPSQRDRVARDRVSTSISSTTGR